jgi:DNA repair protein RadC
MLITDRFYFTDQDLLNKVLHIPIDEMRGTCMREIIENLLLNSEKKESVCLVKEIAQRYGEKRIKTGETFTCSSQIYEHFRVRLAQYKQETFIVTLLDNKHRMITDQVISLGTLNQSLVHCREVFAPAIERRAAAVVICHCHPSGDPKPSQQDINITKRLVDVGNLIGIKVIDHLVIGDNEYFSLVDEDLMPD